MLAEGHLSLNYCAFHDAAIQVSLNCVEWDEAERCCGLLETYAAPEFFSWSDVVVARGRAIGQVGRGKTGPALAATLQALRQQALDAEDQLHLQGVEEALRQLSPGVGGDGL